MILLSKDWIQLVFLFFPVHTSVVVQQAFFPVWLHTCTSLTDFLLYLFHSSDYTF